MTVQPIQPIKDKKLVQDMMKILDDKNPRDALLFRMGLNTILRIQDLLSIKVDHIFRPDGSFLPYMTLFERKTKNHRSRIRKNVKLNSLIRHELKKYVKLFELDQDDFIFFSMKNPEKPIDRIQAWRLLKSAADEVGINNFGTHTMRKTLAWNIYNQTKDIALVMVMLNHRRPEVTMRYLGITQEQMDEAYEEFAVS